MYCPRCEEHRFAGSLCPACGGRMERGGIRFSRAGEPSAAPMSPAAHGPFDAGLAGARGPEVGRKSEGFFVRLGYKTIESAIACALFSVVLRVVIFFVQVVDSLTETGGDIKEGISFAADIQRAISMYEVAVWALLALLIFRFRRNPR